MIDIHCHILPGIDDGAADESVALAMARQAVDEGITELVATPHHRNRHWNNPKAEVIREVANLNERLNANGIPLTVLPGQEVRLFGEINEPALQEELVTVNNARSYMLVEFPTTQVPHYAAQVFFNLQTRGITPIIVHPERNQVFLDHPEQLFQFINDGVLAQVTAASVIGKSGRKEQRVACQFLENNLAQFIASDAHNVTERPFYIRAAETYIKHAYGSPMINQLSENAAQIVRGVPISRDEPIPIQKKKFLGLF
ncbi:MAG: CpsB/CapC family capsule biosynthesis tyrosine phosphatase [Sporolactobacillus sp.]